MNSDEAERPNLHIAPEQRQALLGYLKAADTALRQASKLSRELASDTALCHNCRLDAIQEETVVNCAGFLIENLTKKVSREISGETLKDILDGRLQ